MAEWEYFDRPASAVESNLSTMNARADEAIAEAQDAIDRLADIQFEPEAGLPQITLPPIEIPAPISEPQPPGTDSFGHLYAPSTPTFVDYGDAADLNSILSDLAAIGPFDPQSGSVNMPARPAPIDSSGMPTRPVINDVVLPDAPADQPLDMAELIPIVVPEFLFPTLPAFDGTEPTFDEPRPSTELVFAEPEYDTPLLDETIAKVREWLQGGTGLPPEVQQALFDAARTRESQTALEAVQAAFDTFAGRGFSMPPGMLAEQVNVALEKSRLAQNTLEREQMSKAAQWEIENLRVAVERGIALETVLIGQFNNAAQRSFEAAKVRLDADVNLFNAMVGLYNARSTAYQTAAQVFKIRIEAEMMKLDVFKAQIEGEKVKGELNDQMVRVYESRIKAVNMLIEVYKGRMEGARVQSEIEKTKIEAYRADVAAYGEKLEAEKKRFDAYEAEVRGESAKASSLEAEARAYAATVGAQEAKANVKIKYLDGRIAGLRAGTEKYAADIDLERLQVTASLGEIQARTAAFSADVGRYTAEISGANESMRTELMVSESRLRTNLAYYEAQIKQYDARLGRLLQQSTLIVESLRSAGQFTSALAQGAMSAIHVQASMSGSGSVSDSSSYQRSFQEIHNYKHGA